MCHHMRSLHRHYSRDCNKVGATGHCPSHFSLSWGLLYVGNEGQFPQFSPLKWSYYVDKTHRKTYRIQHRSPRGYVLNGGKQENHSQHYFQKSFWIFHSYLLEKSSSFLLDLQGQRVNIQVRLSQLIQFSNYIINISAYFKKNKKLLYIDHLFCLAPWNVVPIITSLLFTDGKIYTDRLSSFPEAAHQVKAKSRALGIPVLCNASNLLSINSHITIFLFLLIHQLLET